MCMFLSIFSTIRFYVFEQQVSPGKQTATRYDAFYIEKLYR